MNSSSQPPAKNVAAHVAFIYVDVESDAMLRESFRQIGIECLVVDAPEHLARTKIEGCVVGLDHENAGPVLEMLRNSRSNSRVVVFGLEQQPNTAAKFLRYGVSVVLESPLDRRAALKAVRATRGLLLNEFRRYVRIPIALEVAVACGNDTFTTYTEEISGGGLSFKVPERQTVSSDAVRVAFALPARPRMSMDAVVCWQKPDDRTAGVRFEGNESGRQIVKGWIDDYLQLS